MGLTAVNAFALPTRSQVIRVHAECVALNFHKCVLKVFFKPDKLQRGCIISERLKCPAKAPISLLLWCKVYGECTSVYKNVFNYQFK